MNRILLRTHDIVVEGLPHRDGTIPAVSISTRRRSLLTDLVILSAVEVRYILRALHEVLFRNDEQRRQEVGR